MDEIPLPELPDPLSIPLPDEIPIPPDEIPLPPEEDAEPQQPSHQQQQQHSTQHHQLPARKRKRADNTSPPGDGATSPHEHKKPCPEEEALMSRLMGFTSFNSTKGKPVPGNQSVGAVHVVKRRRYRQYMNRKGGFNRPLDKVN